MTKEITVGKRPSIYDCWVMKESPPRKTQVTAFDWMSSMPDKVRYLFLEVPVGGGKSPIALTYAAYLGGGSGTSYILTPQKILQKQYEDSFAENGLTSMYGRANYRCSGKPGLTCEEGNIAPKCSNCPASAAFTEMGRSQHTVLNYKLGLMYSEIHPDDSHVFAKRDLMVFDECHTLESHLVEHRKVSMSKSKLKKFMLTAPHFTTLKAAFEFLGGAYLTALSGYHNDLARAYREIVTEHEFETSPVYSPSEVKTIREMKRLGPHYSTVQNLVKAGYEAVNEYYVLVTENGNTHFKEVFGKSLFHTILKSKAHRFLFMSSTIMNYDGMLSDLGIDPSEAAFLSVGSEFEPKDRPVYFMPTARMAYGWNNNEPSKNAIREKMKNRVIELCNMHENESGIIHTGSFAIANWLIDEIKDAIPHQIFHHTADAAKSRDLAINMFMNQAAGTPSLLISPSVTEGLDLKYDLGRFAIFTKVPYPFLGDSWVKRRKELSNEWYQRQAMLGIIQGGGRVVRAPDDFGNTYILDETFSYLHSQYFNHIPQWWKDGYSVVK